MSSNTAVLPAPLTRDETGTLFGQTMGLVAVTAGLFALGAYLGRNMSYGWGWVFWIAAFASLIGMNAVAQRSERGAVTLLFGLGVLVGLASGTDAELLREHQPAGSLAGRRGDSTCHRRLRGCWLRDASRSLGDGARPFLGTDRVDRLRHSGDLRPDSAQFADLRRGRSRDLRRPDGVRLPASAERSRHPGRTPPRGVDLSGCHQCLPSAAVALRQPRLKPAVAHNLPREAREPLPK